MSRLTRILTRLAGTLFAFIILLFGTLIFLATTAPGLSLTAKALESLVPGLSIGRTEGDWRHLAVSEVGWSSPGLELKVQKFVVELDWYKLFDRELRIGRLEIESPVVRIDSAKFPQPEALPEASSPFALPDLELPFGISLADLGVRDAQAAIDGEAAGFEALAAGLDLHGGILKLQDLSLSGFSSGLGGIPLEAKRFEASGRMTKAELVLEQAALSDGCVDLSRLGAASEPSAKTTFPKNAEVPKTANPPQSLLERVKALFAEPFVRELPRVSLPFRAAILSLTTSRTHVSGIPGTEGLPGFSPLEIRSLELKASMEASKANLERLKVDSSIGALDASGEVDFRGRWPVRLALSLEADAAPWGALAGLKLSAPQALLKSTLTGEAAGEMTFTAKTEGPFEMSLRAMADLGEADPPFSLSLASAEIISPEMLAPVPHAASPAAEAAPASSAEHKTQEETAGALANDGASGPGALETLLKSRYIVRDLALQAEGHPASWKLALRGKPSIEAPKAILGT